MSYFYPVTASKQSTEFSGFKGMVLRAVATNSKNLISLHNGNILSHRSLVQVLNVSVHDFRRGVVLLDP